MTRTLAFLMVAAGLVGLAATAYGQYYTPLRYDLRQTSPTYIPSGVLRFGPKQADPYRFGSGRYSNLSVTGNLRLGKSFRGNVPYVQSGSQLTETLPSEALSNFRRDSFGVEDLGTDVQYGGTAPYFPDMGSVTTPWNAGSRFDARRFGTRSQFLPPNYNPAFTQPPPLQPSIYAAPGGWTGVYPDPLELSARIETGTPGYALPFLRGETVNADRLGLGLSVRDADAEAAEEAALLASPYDFFRERFDNRPANVLDREKDAESRLRPSDPIERSLRLQYGGAGEAVDMWDLARAEVDKVGDVLPGTPDYSLDGLEPFADEPRPRQDPEEAGRLWQDVTREDVPEGEGEPEPAAVRKPSVPMTVSGYGYYVLRAHEAMKAGQYSQAEALYAAATALDRDRPAAFFGRVHALLGSRLYLQAAKVLENGLEKHPEWARHALDLREVFAKEGMYERIVGDVRQEADEGMGHGQYDFLLGYVLYTSGHAEEARKRLSGPRGDGKARQAILDALPGE